MWTPEIRARLAAERQELARWWQGDRRQPFVISRHAEYCPCDVCCLPLWSRLRMAVRAIIAWIFSQVPFSPPKVWCFRLLGARIGRNVYIAPDVFLDLLYPELLTVEDDVFLGIGCHLLAHEITATNFRLGCVHIGRGSVIGAWATVRSGVTIGCGATVGFHSVVTHDVPDNTTVVGVPARPLPPKGGK